MKNTLQFMLFTLAVFAMSCKKDSVVQTSTANNPVIGEWTISSFIDSSLDKTSQFTGYTFVFDSNAHLQVKGGMMVNMCSWTFTDSVYHFNMMGMHSDALNDLNDDWKLMNFSDTTCTFISDNPNHERMFIMHRP